VVPRAFMGDAGRGGTFWLFMGLAGRSAGCTDKVQSTGAMVGPGANFRAIKSKSH